MDRRWVANAPSGIDDLELQRFDVGDPGPGEVLIRVTAAGMNPADHKHVAPAADPNPSRFPVAIGYEVAGVVEAVGPDARGASGDVAVGDRVVAFRISGGYATRVVAPAADVLAAPARLDDPAAANLLLAGCTAAEMLEVTRVREAETVLLHGASGAVGVSVLQQARLIGARVIGTASRDRFDEVRRFGGEPVEYGAGLEERVRELAPDGVAAALDAVGTDEAVDVSLALVDRARVLTIAAAPRARAEGFTVIAGAMPASKEFRDRIRPRLVELADRGELEVPVAATFALDDARAALHLLSAGHPGGKLALIP